MHLLSGFGDIVVVLPAFLVSIVFLAARGSRQSASALAASLAACLVLSLGAKLATAACGGAHSFFGVESPSGHVALGTAFYGCLAALAGSGRSLVRRLGLYAGAMTIAAAIGYARVAIGAHNFAEVVCGFVIGAASVLLFRVLLGAPEAVVIGPRTVLRLSPIVVLLSLDLVLFADRWTAEPIIDSVAATWGAHMRLCP